MTVDPLNGGGFTAGVVDVNGGVEGAAPNEKAVAGAGVVGALAGVDLPNTAVVLFPHVTMIDAALFVGRVMIISRQFSPGVGYIIVDSVMWSWLSSSIISLFIASYVTSDTRHSGSRHFS